MSKDIRSFFFQKKNHPMKTDPITNKRKAIVVSSDEETPEETTKSIKKKETTTASKINNDKPNLKKLRTNEKELVNVNDIFNTAPKKINKSSKTMTSDGEGKLEKNVDDNLLNKKKFTTENERNINEDEEINKKSSQKTKIDSSPQKSTDVKKIKLDTDELTTSPKKVGSTVEEIKSPSNKTNISSSQNVDKCESPRKIDNKKIKIESHKSPEKQTKELVAESIDMNKKSCENVKIKLEQNETIVKPETNSQSLQKQETTIDDQQQLSWTEKYKPTNVKSIIGQQGSGGNCLKLQNWLKNWYTNHSISSKAKQTNSKKISYVGDGGQYKAALLSGPPGVGKTTTATLVCKELGFDFIEFNASDTRSKKSLEEEVAELLTNQTLSSYFRTMDNNQTPATVTSKHCVIMDEVDGMAGNEDRGGIQSLISLIKNSSVPIICLCNDRNHQKIRALVNYCFDLRFQKPRMEQIRGAMMSILFREGIKVPAKQVEEIIMSTNNDIRQTLNHLTLMSVPIINLNDDDGDGEGGGGSSGGGEYTTAKTDTRKLKLSAWDVVRKVFTLEEHKNMTMTDKSNLFFNDYQMIPLFVQQNYLSVAPSVKSKSEIIERVAKAAESISFGDLIETRIRSKQAWTLLPVQAMFSSVLPGEYMAGHFTGQINFPGWLGKNSKSTKRMRLAQEIHDHTRICTSGSRSSIRLDYASFLTQHIYLPLKLKGMAAIPDTLKILKEYRLLREDLDSLIELSTWPGRKSIADSVDSKVKAALTRAYNKEAMLYTYSNVGAVGKKVKSIEMTSSIGGGGGGIDGGENDGDWIGSTDEEDNDDNDYGGDLKNDALIKVKSTSSSQKSSSSSSSKSSTTKKPSSGSGRKKK